MSKILLKIGILFLFLIFTSCENLPDEVIDNSSFEYSISSIDIPGQIVKSPSNNTINISIEFSYLKNVERVFFDIEDKVSNSKITDKMPLKQFELTFTEAYKLDENFSAGEYLINFYIQDSNGELHKLIEHTIKIENLEGNVAPILSNLSAPDSVIVGDSLAVIELSVDVSDLNGLADIKAVYFIVYRPDSTTSGDQNPMFDDGDFLNHGDQNNNDGTFSKIIKVEPQNQKGRYTFDFYATDKNGLKSTKLSHYIYIL